MIYDFGKAPLLFSDDGNHPPRICYCGLLAIVVVRTKKFSFVVQFSKQLLYRRFNKFIICDHFNKLNLKKNDHE